jgi:hypothetical protein
VLPRSPVYPNQVGYRLLQHRLGTSRNRPPAPRSAGPALSIDGVEAVLAGPAPRRPGGRLHQTSRRSSPAGLGAPRGVAHDSGSVMPQDSHHWMTRRQPQSCGRVQDRGDQSSHDPRTDCASPLTGLEDGSGDREGVRQRGRYSRNCSGWLMNRPLVRNGSQAANPRRLRNWTLMKRQSSRSTVTIAAKPGRPISFA